MERISQFAAGAAAGAAVAGAYVAARASRASQVERDECHRLVEELIASAEVVIFSKSYCPHCAKTKALFGANGNKAKVTLETPPHVIELDHSRDGPAIQACLLRMTGQRTVPSVWIKGQHVGGNSDVQALAESGKLQKMLYQEGKLPSAPLP